MWAELCSLQIALLSILVLWQETELSTKPDDILESTLDAAKWNLEVERVLLQLKVTIRADNKVRAHLTAAVGLEVMLMMQKDAIYVHVLMSDEQD